MDEKSKNQFVAKMVKVMECQPGSADTKNGEKVSILRLESEGKAQTPMMLSLADTKSLAIKLFKILAFWGDPHAEGAVDYYNSISGAPQEGDTAILPHRPTRDSSWGLVSFYGPLYTHKMHDRFDINTHTDPTNLTPFGTIRVAYHDKIASYPVYGAFTDKEFIHVLYRFESASHSSDYPAYCYSTARLDPKQRKFGRSQDFLEYLRTEDWPRFMELIGGQPFRISKRVFFKLTCAQLNKWLSAKKPLVGVYG